MKKHLFLLVALVLAYGQVFSQTLFKVTRDSILIVGEVHVTNQTKDTLGYFVNLGGGKTAFQKIHLKNLGDTAIAIPGQDTLSIRFSGNSTATSIPNVPLAAKPIDATNVQLKWWQNDQELYQSPKIGVIGDSQGRGSYASVYSNSIVGRLQTYITSVATGATLTNYCADGYNSRQLAPTGSNTYVDVARNVTKAIADGNNIIVLINTSNDFAPQAAGGEMTTEESLSNTLLIEDACRQAGVQLLLVSSFPRTSLTTSERQGLHTTADNLQKTFGNRCAYVYHLIEDPANPDQLLPSLQVGDNIHLNDAGCQIVFNALRNMIVGYFTSNTDVAKYTVQRGTSITGPFTDYQTIVQPSTTNLNISADGNYYRVRIFFRGGYFSNWSNVVKGDASGTPVNLSPLVNAGTAQTITLPTSGVTLTATASGQGGRTISTYQWSKVQGGTATITTPAASTTTVTGLVQGSYIFRCTATDNTGATGSADITVTVQAAADGSGTVKFNFTTTAQSVAGWIDVTDGPLAASNSGKSWTDNTTGIGLMEIGNSSSLWGSEYGTGNSANDNGQLVADAGGFATDAAVIASGWYSNNISYSSTASNQLKLTGLNAAKRYMIKIYGSLGSNYSSLDASPTQFIVNDNVLNQKLVNANSNTSQVAVFKGIKPSSSGIIPIFVGVPAGQATFGMINGLSVVEDNTSSSILPTVNAGADLSIILPTNSVQLSAILTDDGAEPTGITWTKTSGPAATIASASTLQTAITGLVQGTYIFRCSITDNNGQTGYDEVTVVVNAANSNPKFNVAFSKGTFTQSGWTVLAGQPHVAVVSGSASFSGNTINISTVGTANWLPFIGTASADSTGEVTDDGGGFAAPARVVKGNFFNLNAYNASTPQITISNLPAGTYTVTVLGSIQQSIATSNTLNCNTEYRVNGSAAITVNDAGNTSKTAVFTGITVAANGSINVFANALQNNVNQYVAALSYIILEKTN